MADFTSLNGYDVKDKNAIHIQDVIDNLESTEMQKPLSANQGKELKNLIDNITIEESNLGNSIYDYNKDQYLNFTEHCRLNIQGRGIQAATTDGNYLYYIDWFGNDVDSYLVKCNLDGTEISRNNIGQGHFNSMCYCSKDGYLYSTTNPVSIYDRETLTLVKTIYAPVEVGTIDYLPMYDVFIFNRINGNEYFYMTYDVFQNRNVLPEVLNTLEYVFLYKFNAVAENDVRQGACFGGDFFFKISDRERFGKKSCLMKYTQYGQYCCDVITLGIPSKEYEDMFYLNNYFYIVTFDGYVYKGSENDYNNKNILSYDTDPKLSRAYTVIGSRFCLYNNLSDYPSTYVPSVGDTYAITNILSPSSASEIDIYYGIEGQRAPSNVIRATLGTNDKFIANDMKVIALGDSLAMTLFRGVFSITTNNDNEQIITIDELYCKKITLNGSNFTITDVTQFDIYAFIAQF